MYEWPWHQWDVAAFYREYRVCCCYVRGRDWSHCILVNEEEIWADGAMMHAWTGVQDSLRF